MSVHGLRLTGHARLPGLVRQHRPSPFPVKLSLAVAALVASVALWLAGQPLAASFVAIASVGIVVGWAAAFLIARRAISRPLEQIADSLEALAARDVLALVDEFANLAQGEQARDLTVHAVPVQLPSDRNVRRVAEALNTAISRLQAGASQFRAASEEPCRRLFYVGPDDYLLGCTCADAMGSRLPDGGQVLLLMPHFTHTGVELRRRGFASVLRERFPRLQVVGAVESRLDTARTSELVRSFIKTHPHLAGIYCTEANGVLGVIDALGSSELASRPVVICHDLLDGTMAGVRAGLISATVTQDPFGQGHDTPIHLFNNIAHGWLPAEPRIITTSELITPDNYRQFRESYRGATESPAMASRRAKPLGRSRRHLRIAVLGLDDTSFWVPVRNGVLAAAKELAACNASVDWIVPEGDRSFDVSTRGPAVEALVREGYDAIATSIYEFDLVPYLNRAVDQGVVVATINSEASSLQGLVATLSKERKRLEISASELEVAASHDALTGTYNRLVMSTDLKAVRQSSLGSKQPAAVIMIDIDHFKAYNDTYGHAAGDKALRLVARRIQQGIRSRDRLYRYGGEEFLVLLRDTPVEVVEAVATRIAAGIATLGLAHEGNPPWGVVTVSAGVAAVDLSSAPAGDGVAGADAAMYRSKRSGRNRVTTYKGAPAQGPARLARTRSRTGKKVA